MNPKTTRYYVEEALLSIQDMIEVLDEKLNILLLKKETNWATKSSIFVIFYFI